MNDSNALLNEGTTLAPPGKVWVCRACGKRSRTRYGFVMVGELAANMGPDGKSIAQHGWDESCMLNAELREDTVAP